MDMTCVSPKLEIPRRGRGDRCVQCVWQLEVGGEGEWMATGDISVFSKLFFASVSKRVLLQNHSCENVFHLQVHELNV